MKIKPKRKKIYMWFGTRTGLPEGALWSTQDGASFIQYSKMKEILHQQFFFLLFMFVVVVLNHPPLKVLCFRKSHFKCELCKRDAGY